MPVSGDSLSLVAPSVAIEITTAPPNASASPTIATTTCQVGRLRRSSRAPAEVLLRQVAAERECEDHGGDQKRLDDGDLTAIERDGRRDRLSR